MERVEEKIKRAGKVAGSSAEMVIDPSLMFTNAMMAVAVDENGETIDNLTRVNPVYAATLSFAELVYASGHEDEHRDGVADESIADLLAKKKAKELMGGDFNSGYDQLVGRLERRSAFKQRNYDDLKGYVHQSEVVDENEKGDEIMLNNILDLFVVEEWINKGAAALTAEGIKAQLARDWSLINDLFPRITSKVLGRKPVIHGEVNENLNLMDLSGLEIRLAHRVFNDEVMFEEVLDQVFSQEEFYADDFANYPAELLKYLGENEDYGYLVNYISQSDDRFSEFKAKYENYHQRDTSENSEVSDTKEEIQFDFTPIQNLNLAI